MAEAQKLVSLHTFRMRVGRHAAWEVGVRAVGTYATQALREKRVGMEVGKEAHQTNVFREEESGRLGAGCVSCRDAGSTRAGGKSGADGRRTFCQLQVRY